jgi:hypothetical protein
MIRVIQSDNGRIIVTIAPYDELPFVIENAIEEGAVFNDYYAVDGVITQKYIIWEEEAYRDYIIIEPSQTFVVK